MLHGGLFTDSEKEMHFPSCNFCFKRRLGEPEQFKTWLQFGQAYQSVGTTLWLSFTQKEQGITGKLARILTVSLEHGIAMSVQRGVTGLK
jgi:hypothetical protein